MTMSQLILIVVQHGNELNLDSGITENIIVRIQLIDSSGNAVVNHTVNPLVFTVNATGTGTILSAESDDFYAQNLNGIYQIGVNQSDTTITYFVVNDTKNRNPNRRGVDFCGKCDACRRRWYV